MKTLPRITSSETGEHKPYGFAGAFLLEPLGSEIVIMGPTKTAVLNVVNRLLADYPHEPLDESKVEPALLTKCPALGVAHLYK